MQEGMTTSSEETSQSDVSVPTNGSKSEGAAGTSLDLAEQGGATKTALALNPPEPPARQATGSRTKMGKKRPSQNATKQGIVSAVTVLEGESRAKYESLLRGLWEAFQPEGKLEKILVEKLATLLWRHRRLIVAESAEIQKKHTISTMGSVESATERGRGDREFVCARIQRWLDTENPKPACPQVLLGLAGPTAAGN